MPLIIPPALVAAAQAYKQRLQEQDSQYTQAINRKQGEIAGTAGPAPGLQASEDLNASLYTQLGVLISPYEMERRALDGQYAAFQVQESDILEAASTRSGILFPTGNNLLIPSRLPELDGKGSTDASNENDSLAAESDALSTLLSLAEGARAADPAYASWVSALSNELSALNAEAAALAANEVYGTGSQPYLDVQTALGFVNALLPSPPVTDDDITTRQGQVGLRQGQVAVRVDVVGAEAGILYDHRYQILQGRVNLVIGSLARLVATQSGIANLQLIQSINSDVLALYNQLV